MRNTCLILFTALLLGSPASALAQYRFGDPEPEKPELPAAMEKALQLEERSFREGTGVAIGRGLASDGPQRTPRPTPQPAATPFPVPEAAGQIEDVPTDLIGAVPQLFDDERAPVVEVRYYPGEVIDPERPRDLFVITRYIYESGLVHVTPVGVPDGIVYPSREMLPPGPLPIAPSELELIKSLLITHFHEMGIPREELEKLTFFGRSSFARSPDSALFGKRIARVHLRLLDSIPSLSGLPVRINLTDKTVIKDDTSSEF